jgi:hypothetical protein
MKTPVFEAAARRTRVKTDVFNALARRPIMKTRVTLKVLGGIEMLLLKGLEKGGDGPKDTRYSERLARRFLLLGEKVRMRADISLSRYKINPMKSEC